MTFRLLLIFLFSIGLKTIDCQIQLTFQISGGSIEKWLYDEEGKMHLFISSWRDTIVINDKILCIRPKQDNDIYSNWYLKLDNTFNILDSFSIYPGINIKNAVISEDQSIYFQSRSGKDTLHALGQEYISQTFRNKQDILRIFKYSPKLKTLSLIKAITAGAFEFTHLHIFQEKLWIWAHFYDSAFLDNKIYAPFEFNIHSRSILGLCLNKDSLNRLSEHFFTGNNDNIPFSFTKHIDNKLYLSVLFLSDRVMYNNNLFHKFKFNGLNSLVLELGKDDKFYPIMESSGYLNDFQHTIKSKRILTGYFRDSIRINNFEYSYKSKALDYFVATYGESNEINNFWNLRSNLDNIGLTINDQLHNSNLLVSGHFRGNITLSNNKVFSSKGSEDLFIGVLDNNLNAIWETIISGTQRENILEIKRTREGDYLFCGLSNSDTLYFSNTYVRNKIKGTYFVYCLKNPELISSIEKPILKSKSLISIEPRIIHKSFHITCDNDIPESLTLYNVELKQICNLKITDHIVNINMNINPGFYFLEFKFKKQPSCFIKAIFN